MQAPLPSTSLYVPGTHASHGPPSALLEPAAQGAATQSVERYASEDVILGFLPAPTYTARQLELEPGDCVLLYTDGITEAVDQAEEMFGEERLAAQLAALASDSSAQQILDGLVAELDRFRDGQRQGDDVTAVVIRCTEQGLQP